MFPMLQQTIDAIFIKTLQKSLQRSRKRQLVTIRIEQMEIPFTP
jgi:hypothetical protein